MTEQTASVSSRIAGIDAYRGLVMFLMMAEVLRLQRVSRAVADSPFWAFLAHHQSHVPWVGCSLHDLIQPSFSFLVGVAMPYSIGSRLARGHSRRALTLHAAWRAFLLVALGVLLRSLHREQTYYTFEDTLSQIGLGYFPLFLLALTNARWRWSAFILIVIGYWAAFALYPAVPPEFDYSAVGVPPDWAHHSTGLAAHWNKNSNLAWAFDTWFLNLFPREQVFTHNAGGYATLSFVPTLGTMLLGLIGGAWLKSEATKSRKLVKLVVTGALLLLAGLAADHFGICPNVKRIWTPSWTLFSGGWCFLILAAFYGVCDVWKMQAWSYPFRVIGANSITAYCIAHLIENFLVTNFKIHFGPDVFTFAGAAYEPLLEGTAVLACYWLILWWMYRNKIFLKI